MDEVMADVEKTEHVVADFIVEQLPYFIATGYQEFVREDEWNITFLSITINAHYLLRI